MNKKSCLSTELSATALCLTVAFNSTEENSISNPTEESSNVQENTASPTQYYRT